MVASRSIWRCRSVSICRPMLFKYDGNILRISWNCSSPGAKFKSSDSWAAAGTAKEESKDTSDAHRWHSYVPFGSQPIRERVKSFLAARLEFDQVHDARYESIYAR